MSTDGRKGSDVTQLHLQHTRKCLLVSPDQLQTIFFLNRQNFKGSHIEVYSRIGFPKHDFQFNYDTKCRVYVAILHHSGLTYKMF